MKYQQLKSALRYEFKLTAGQYHMLCINNDFKREPYSIFEVDFCLNFSTLMFCKRTIKEGDEFFEIVKIITIQLDGEVRTFTTQEGGFTNALEAFVNYIKSLDAVESVEFLKPLSQ